MKHPLPTSPVKQRGFWRTTGFVPAACAACSPQTMTFPAIARSSARQPSSISGVKLPLLLRWAAGISSLSLVLLVVPYQVESVWCPYLGDVAHPAGAVQFESFQCAYARANVAEIWPHFQNQKGYYGVDYPTQMASRASSGCAPSSPFILLKSEQMGLYCGVQDDSSEPVCWQLELRPGYGSSIDARVSEEKEIGGPVAGNADILIVNDIDVGNVMHKSLGYFAHARNAGIVIGAKAPVLIASRSDSTDTRLDCIKLGVLLADYYSQLSQANVKGNTG